MTGPRPAAPAARPAPAPHTTTREDTMDLQTSWLDQDTLDKAIASLPEADRRLLRGFRPMGVLGDTAVIATTNEHQRLRVERVAGDLFPRFAAALTAHAPEPDQVLRIATIHTDPLEPATPTPAEDPAPTTGPVPGGKAVADVTAALGELRAVYGPTVTLEAAALLEDLRFVVAAHGFDDVELVGVVADAAGTRYRGSRQPDRTIPELHRLLAVLSTALEDLGLTIVPNYGSRSGVAVATLPDGVDLKASTLTISLFLDGGWDLSADRPGSSVLSLYAPVTEAGAREVALVVHEILTGKRPNPWGRDR